MCLSDEKTDLLVLLVGGNPLPNAVAANLLLQETGKALLLHSKQTLSVAKQLKKWIKGIYGEAQITLIELRSGTGMNGMPEYDPQAIVETIEEDVFKREDLQGISSLGLNYTGGTKAMSVHVHRTLETWSKSPGRRFKSSYLNPKDMKLVFDHDRHIGYDVAQVDLGIGDLVNLHGWKFQPSPATDPVLPGTAKALIEVYSQDTSRSAWVRWVVSELYPKARRWEQAQYPVRIPNSSGGFSEPDQVETTSGKWKNNTDLASVDLDLPNDQNLEKVVGALRCELGIDNDVLSVTAAARHCNYKKFEDMCKWLEGTWLESVCLLALREISEEEGLGLHDICMNLEPKGVNAPGRHFEFDVAAMRGYQLFALSCTVDEQRGMSKFKLFEAYSRARQLGGDEARVALLCYFEDPKGLQGEVTRDIDPEGHIRVIKPGGFAALKEDLVQWIKTQSGRR
jgi:hypothetical protein